MRIGIISAVLLSLALFGFVFTFGWVNVHPTEVAVEINKVAGKVETLPRGVGYHFFNRWMTDMVIYRVSARAFPRDSGNTEGHENEWNMSLKTNDGQGIDVDFTVIYSLNSNEVPALHQTVGPDFESQIILPQVRSGSRIAIGEYSAEQMYDGKIRSEIQDSIKTRLVASLKAYPAINIQDTLMRDFRFQNADFQRAIEAKKLASQTVEVNKNRALAQEQEAKRVEAEASGLKLKAVQEAEGRAQSVKIEADAQRYQLEQEAAGKLAIYKSEAEGKRLLAEALGGGQNVVALKFAEQIPSKLQIWGIPVGQQSTSFMDVSGIFQGMFPKRKE